MNIPRLSQARPARKLPLPLLPLLLLLAPVLPRFSESSGLPTAGTGCPSVPVMKTTGIPFVRNEGQMCESVAFSAHAFGGAVFVTNDGEIVYSLPGRGPRGDAAGVALGERVRTLVDSAVAAGRHRATWDGRDGHGSPAGSGVYFARLETGGIVRNETLVLLK